MCCNNSTFSVRAYLPSTYLQKTQCTIIHGHTYTEYYGFLKFQTRTIFLFVLNSLIVVCTSTAISVFKLKRRFHHDYSVNEVRWQSTVSYADACVLVYPRITLVSQTYESILSMILWVAKCFSQWLSSTV